MVADVTPEDENLVSLEGMSVTIGMPVDNPIPHRTVISLCHTVARLVSMNIPFSLSMHVSGVVTIGRDAVLDDFLKTGLQKLFWIDSDMVWTPDDFIRLLAMSAKVDVVGCTYPAKVSGPLTFYANFDEDRRTGPFGLQEVKGMGLGFTVVDRKVCEELAAKAPRVIDQINGGEEMASVFRVDIVDGKRRTEDMAFFSDIRDLGYTVWIDPYTALGHIGDHQWFGSMSQAFEEDKNQKVKASG